MAELLREESYSDKILKGIYENLPILVTHLNRSGFIIESIGSTFFGNRLNNCSIDLNESEKFNNILLEFLFQNKSKLEALFEIGGNLTFELKINCTNGTIKYFNNYAFPIINSHGDTEVIVISLDRTNFTPSNKTFNKTNLELNAIIDAIPDIYFNLDYSGNILSYKVDANSQLFISEESLVGKPLTHLFPNHLTANLIHSIETVKRTQKLHTLEYFISSESKLKFFEARFLPLSTVEIIVIIREITDKVNYQEKMIEKERLLLETQRIAKVFSFFWDLEENSVTWTDEFYNMIQLNPENFNNTPAGYIEFVHPDDREKLILEIANTIRNKKNFYAEYRFMLPGNKIVHLLTEARLKLDSNGNPIKMLGLCQDITQRKHYEIDLLAQKQELERLIENIENIIALKTEELVSAKENAEKANQVKTLFLANISHELKTPIHAIMSFAELGKDKVDNLDPTRIKEYFSIIYDSGNRLFTLMSNILDLSKMDSGNETYIFSQGDIYELTQKTIQELEGLINKKNLKVTIDNNTSSTIAMMDYSKITQVVRNLLANAIKFSPDNSSIKIELSSGNYSFSNNDLYEPTIIWKVIDSGEGIEIDEKELIFKKFQLGKRIKPGTSGTGLGLAICKEIISGHRGTIYADNNSKLGAEFVFLIPQNQEV